MCMPENSHQVRTRFAHSLEKNYHNTQVQENCPLHILSRRSDDLTNIHKLNDL